MKYGNLSIRENYVPLIGVPINYTILKFYGGLYMITLLEHYSCVYYET